MRNFLRFVRRFSNLLLFLTLEVICFVLIARTNTMQGSDVMSSANSIAGFFYKKQNDVTYYFNLRTANDQLVAENARLRSALSELKYSVDTLSDSSATVELPASPGDSTHILRYARYTYRSARVINNSVTEKNNFITINRGSADGIARNMAVITSNGVVGKVVNVSRHFASVVSVLSQTQRVSGQFKDGTAGMVEWQENGSPDILYMNNVPPEIKLHLGDTVTTTSYSFFPPGVAIGTVKRVDILKKNNRRIVQLRPAANFRNLQFVYVIENAYAPEQQALELQNNSKKGGVPK